MDEQILSEYTALTNVPCDSPLQRIDPDDMMMLIFLLILLSCEPEERDRDSMREQIQRLTDKLEEREGGKDVQQTDDRT